MKSITKNMKRVIAEAAKKSARIEANKACLFWNYQPKEPEEVKKLRKF